MTAQKGSTMPMKISPMSSCRPVATAGSTPSVWRVNSIQGIGIRRMGSVKISPETVGSST